MVQENAAKIIVGLYGVVVTAIVCASIECTKAYKQHLKEEDRILKKHLKELLKSNEE